MSTVELHPGQDRAWTPERDAELLAMRARNMTWKAVTAGLGVGKSEAERRLKALKRASGETPVANAVRAVHRHTDNTGSRDGLDWLKRHDRLSWRQSVEADAWRSDYRAVEEAGPVMKSGLDFGVKVDNFGKPPGWPAGGYVVRAIDAEKRLAFKRTVILKGQRDTLEVLDGVCGRGLTLRELAGGNDRKADALLAVLKVALDILAAGVD